MQNNVLLLEITADASYMSNNQTHHLLSHATETWSSI